MPNENIIGPNQIPMEVWKCLGEKRLKQSSLMSFSGMQRCPKNEDTTQLSLSTRTKVIFKITITMEVLSCLATL